MEDEDSGRCRGETWERGEEGETSGCLGGGGSEVSRLWCEKPQLRGEWGGFGFEDRKGGR